MSSYRGNFTGVILYAGEALELLNKEDFRWRNIAEITYALANSWAGFGNFTIARQAFQKAQQSSEKIEDVYLYIFSGMCIAATEVLQGECHKAVETYSRLIDEAEKKGMANSGILGSIYAALGSIYCEMNDIEKGRSLLKKGKQVAELGHDALMLAATRLNEIRLHFYTQDLSQVLKVLNEMESIPHSSFYPPWIRHVLSAIRPWIWMRTGHQKKAEEWAIKLGFPAQDDMSMRREIEYTVLARFLIAQRDTNKAGKLLGYLMIDAQKGDRLFKIVELKILKSINLYFQDKIKPSVEELYSALSFAEPRGLFRVFVYEGELLAELIEVILDEKSNSKKDPYPDVSELYLKNLIETIREDKQKSGTSYLEEALSERELEVLQYIADGLTNKQIADKLFVSLNTIRTHTKKMNSKLGVHSRTQAVARAKELGLIE
jgi:LuxR family maltose regulon positive regulatory protein